MRCPCLKGLICNNPADRRAMRRSAQSRRSAWPDTHGLMRRSGQWSVLQHRADQVGTRLMGCPNEDLAAAERMHTYSNKKRAKKDRDLIDTAVNIVVRSCSGRLGGSK